MRMEIRALAINRRSIVTMKRLNKPAEGARPRETVLDISVPFRAVQRIAALGSGDKLRIPDASNNPFVCIAAYSSLQRSILLLRVVPFEASKKGRRKPVALEGIEIIAYSAAALRGGSSAPESWISAT